LKFPNDPRPPIGCDIGQAIEFCLARMQR
jgi:hypothetical protein